ncbi:MTH1187 family thiamine-binding protein [Caldichromatium japonicum]|uniref:MTH1187 family thiamine-binding protein n=1 Tax=Caldichromatium japonicum TaxID=2699430 RepID=A0A6G7V9K5_9GAMM|nr:MTH1187 family thiamine-binding protein [Caldichromatium japonicum]QIK36753.1 MTH1187 family thiamine-binding protein [Caldichromatium japonicum]
MSVILDLSLFPLDQGVSLSRFVAPVIAMIQETGLPHHLSPMGTQVETETLPEALALIERAQTILADMGAKRVYAVAKFDIREGPPGRLTSKIESVRARLDAPPADGP